MSYETRNTTQETRSEQKAKKEMKENGVGLTIALIVLVFVWGMRKLLVKK